MVVYIHIVSFTLTRNTTVHIREMPYPVLHGCLNAWLRINNNNNNNNNNNYYNNNNIYNNNNNNNNNSNNNDSNKINNEIVLNLSFSRHATIIRNTFVLKKIIL